VVAEKVETLVTLGMANTRMKDYFDLWLLQQEGGLEPVQLQSALVATFTRRARPMPDRLPTGLSDDFANDAQKQRQWQAFLKKNQLEPVELSQVITSLRAWLLPMLLDSSQRTQ